MFRPFDLNFDINHLLPYANLNLTSRAIPNFSSAPDINMNSTCPEPSTCSLPALISASHWEESCETQLNTPEVLYSKWKMLKHMFVPTCIYLCALTVKGTWALYLPPQHGCSACNVILRWDCGKLNSSEFCNHCAVENISGCERRWDTDVRGSESHIRGK